MPSYKGKDGRWRYRFTHRGKQYSGSTPKGTNTQRAANQLEKEHFERVQSKRFLGVTPTVAELAVMFLEYQQAHTRKLTHSLQTTQIEVHVLPHIGRVRIDEVGSKDIDDLITAWRKVGAAVRTINARLGTVGRMFGLAVEWTMLNAAPRIKQLKVPKDLVRFLSDDEADRLLAAARKRRGDRIYRWSSMVFIALRTGLRAGELRGLCWVDIDFQRAVLRVQRSDPGLAGVPAGPTKGGKPRLVPLTPMALEVLRGELAHRTELLGRKPAFDDHVWPGIEDATRSRSESSCVHAISGCFKLAEIEERDGDRLGWHTLRHTYASQLAIRGVSLREIQDLLGHASIRQTERYAHLVPDAVHHRSVAMLDAAVVQLDAGAQLELGPGDQEDDDA